MSALAKRCSTSSEACVRRCRKATSPAKRMRSTPRSRRSRKDTDRRSRLRLPLRQRRPRPPPESRTQRLQRPLHRPLPQNSPLSSAPLRLRRRGLPYLQRDRLHKRGPQANPAPQTRPFHARRRSGPRRPRRNVASRRGTRRKRQPRLRDGLPRGRRRRLRRLDPSWLLQWPTSPPPDRGPARPLHPWGRRAARMRVCPGWRR